MNRAVKWVAGVMMLLGTAAIQAEVYHYTDSAGRKIYVDRKSKIPPQYREQISVRQEESQTLGRIERERREQAFAAQDVRNGVQAELARIETRMAALEQRAEIKGNSVRVPVEIRYLGKTTTANLIADTGASRTILHRNIARRLGASTQVKGQARVVGGAQIPLSMMNAGRVSFGPISMDDIELAVIDPSEAQSYDGLLGMDILSSLKYEFDLERSVVIWDANQHRDLAQQREALLAKMK